MAQVFYNKGFLPSAAKTASGTYQPCVKVFSEDLQQPENLPCKQTYPTMAQAMQIAVVLQRELRQRYEDYQVEFRRTDTGSAEISENGK